MLSTTYIKVVESIQFVVLFVSVCPKKKNNKKCPNNKKEIYNDKYSHTRDRLFGLGRQYAFKISDFILHIAQIQTLMLKGRWPLII
jgi:hypothetical protein